MFQIIPAAARFQNKIGWLNTYHLFSFADYYDPANMNFGPLRVFNDDRIDAYYGFDEHPHKDMEIVTLMLEGELTHRDSLGNTAKIKAGEVQKMSAGTGVIHAEKNLAGDPVHLYQLWFMPRHRNLPPDYHQADFSYRQVENDLTLLASGYGEADALPMDTDARLYSGKLSAGKSLDLSLADHEGVFIYVTNGSLAVNDELLEAGSQLRATEVPKLKIAARSDSHFILIKVSANLKSL